MLKERCSKVYPTSRGYKRIVGNNWLAHYYAVVAVRRGRPVSVAGEGHVRRNSRKLPLLKERQQAARGQIWRHSGRPAVAADGLVRWQAVRECAAALLLVAGRECGEGGTRVPDLPRLAAAHRRQRLDHRQGALQSRQGRSVGNVSVLVHHRGTQSALRVLVAVLPANGDGGGGVSISFRQESASFPMGRPRAR